MASIIVPSAEDTEPGAKKITKLEWINILKESPDKVYIVKRFFQAMYFRYPVFPAVERKRVLKSMIDGKALVSKPRSECTVYSEGKAKELNVELIIPQLVGGNYENLLAELLDLVENGHDNVCLVLGSQNVGFRGKVTDASNTSVQFSHPRNILLKGFNMDCGPGMFVNCQDQTIMRSCPESMAAESSLNVSQKGLWTLCPSFMVGEYWYEM